MSIKFINDWRYLFSKDAIGGRFSVFTPIMISYLSIEMQDSEYDLDGLTIVVLGLGLKIRFK